MNIPLLTKLGHSPFLRGLGPFRHLGTGFPLLFLIGSLAMNQIQAQSDTSLGAAEMPESILNRDQVSQPVLPAWALVPIELEPLTSAELGTMASRDEGGPGPLQIGFQRPIPQLQDPYGFWARQSWYWTSGGGLVFGFSISSPGAQALRLGIRIFNIPDTAKIRVFPPGMEQAQEITGAQIKVSLQRNLDAGEIDEDARTFWSPVIEGQTAIIEMELPSSANPEDLEISLPQISHLFQSPYGVMGMEENAAAPCELDVMCSPAWDGQSKATARMIFTKLGASFLCTGTLLNDADPATYIPYFYTAYHCISTQTAASSLQTYWFWRATACNSGIQGNSKSLIGGADLLYASEITDTSFMRLSSPPPAGAIFAGWSASLPATYTSLTGIHHPGGDLQKISFGYQESYWHCWDAGQGAFSCLSASANDADHYSVIWNSGITEPGSSGSGIFLNDSLQFVGSLLGGTSNCVNPSGHDFYGRFDIPYQAEIYKWLNSPFHDVSPNSWAAKYINAIFKVGITGGCGNGNYCPTGLVTREEMAAFLVRAADKEPPLNYCGVTPPFTDVSTSAWSCGYIKRLAELNITGGCGDGNYCPTGLVSREQMAAFIVRALHKEPVQNYCAGVAPFKDVSPLSWACGYIKRLAELEVTGGCGNDNYCPDGLVTREQMAAFLGRAFLDMD